MSKFVALFLGLPQSQSKRRLKSNQIQDSVYKTPSDNKHRDA